MREKREAVALLEDQAEERARFFKCPECPQQFETPDGLGAHLERHREVTESLPPSPRGKPRSFPCPKDCGRHFRKLSGEDYKSHVALCDGSEPLVVVIEEPRKEDPVANLKCEKCGKKYKHAKRLETHQAECGERESIARKAVDEEKPEEVQALGGGDAGPLAALIRSEGDVSVKDHTLNMLEAIESHYEGKLKQVKILISAVRNASELEA